MPMNADIPVDKMSDRHLEVESDIGVRSDGTRTHTEAALTIYRFVSRIALTFLVLLSVMEYLSAAQGATPGSPPAHRDCLNHNPNTLRIEPNLGAWLLTDGYSRMAMFDSRDDAAKALALAQRYTLHCFIGRHSSNRPGVTAFTRRNYILNYWDGPTGKATAIPAETCTNYDPAQLRMADKGVNGWIVTDGRALTLTLDNEADATAAVALAKRYTAYCTIGHHDFAKRSSRLDYWK
jgi:hypothetical protein